MNQLLEHCILLKTAFSELQGATGRRHHISDVDDWPVWGPTDSWRSWQPWVADVPDPWGAYVLARCEPLSRAVQAIRDVRAKLAASTWVSPTPERAFAAHLEYDVLGRSWLAEIEDGHMEGTGQDAKWFPSGKLYLVTLPAPYPSLDVLVAMAKEAASTGALVGGRGNDTPRRKARKSPPKRVGRKLNIETTEGRRILAIIRRMVKKEATWSQVSAEIEEKFPHLKPYSADRARAFRDREDARVKARGEN